MTAAAFLRSLPKDPEIALDEVLGALKYGDDLTPEYRQVLVTARAECQRRLTNHG